ncbi:MAG: reverse transcriptase family protein, partial [Pseudomonadota bacterium]
MHIWNLSLQIGIFPKCYKKSDIIPLPKVKHPKNVKDVRGISVTPIAARLFEKMVHRRWISSNILSRGDALQFAYKKGLSTIDYLLCLQHFILGHLDKSSVDGIHVVAVDFSMAFDRVDQEIAAMNYNKFIDSLHISKWLYNFTINRMQRLIWRDTPYEYVHIERGCSQGTVGGPSIFSMLTDDVQASDPSCSIFKYSDDMCCAIPCLSDPNNVDKSIFHREMNHFYKTVKLKGLSINIEKTKHIRFCLNNVPVCKCLPSVTSCSQVSEQKILGVIFEENCSFKKHCKSLLSHLRSLLFLFKDLKLKSVPLRDIGRFFNGIIVSRIRYGISVYGSDTRSLKKIDKFLEKCYDKQYCTQRIFVNDILRSEDKRLLHEILCNTRHPLYDYLTSHFKHRITRHGFYSVKPKTRTLLFAS